VLWIGIVLMPIRILLSILMPIHIRNPDPNPNPENQKIFNLYSFIFLVSVIGVMIFNVLDTYKKKQGSGSGLDPYSIGPVDPDPYSIGTVDPDPYSESGSGSRRAKMTYKSRKNSCFEVLDGLFCELQASSVTWTYFMEA
jgi:hypothetical protein